jgi:hypothetical protein
MYSLLCVLMSIYAYDEPLDSKHAAINTSNKTVLTFCTHLIIRKQNGMSKYKIVTVNIFLSHFQRGVAGNKLKIA